MTLALIAVIVACVTVDINVLRHERARIVDAEERGIPVTLTYQRGYSTWGPTNVYGAAVLWPREGVATLSVHLLPHLESGDRYVWWVTNTRTGAAARIGVFNTTQAGDVFLDTFLAGSLPRGADAVLVTIAHRGDPLTAPGPERTLYGPVTIVPQPLSPPTPSGAGTLNPTDPSGSSSPANHAGQAQPGASGNPDGPGAYRPPAALPVTGGGQLLHRRAGGQKHR